MIVDDLAIDVFECWLYVVDIWFLLDQQR